MIDELRRRIARAIAPPSTTCSGCGSEIPEDPVFCPACGERDPVQPEVVVRGASRETYETLSSTLQSEVGVSEELIRHE